MCGFIKSGKVTGREMTAASFLLHRAQPGDLELLTIGVIDDKDAESGNGSNKHPVFAAWEDMGRFRYL